MNTRLIPKTISLSKVFGPLNTKILFQDDKERISITSNKRGKLIAKNHIRFNEITVEKKGLEQLVRTTKPLYATLLQEKVPAIVEEKQSAIYTNKKNKKSFHTQATMEINNETIATIEENYSVYATQFYTGEENPLQVTHLNETNYLQYQKIAHEFLKKDIHTGIDSKEKFLEKTKNTIWELITDTNTLSLLATRNEVTKGYVSANIHPALHLNGYECMARELHVNKENQNEKIGAILFQILKYVAEEKNCKRISLATNWENKKQQLFYKKIGYHKRCDFVSLYLQKN